MTLGNQLKEVRIMLGISQDDVADRLNTSRITLAHWENNEKMPDIPSLILLSEYYHLSLDTLLKEDKKKIKIVSEQTVIHQIKQCSLAFATSILMLLIVLFLIIQLHITFFLIYLFLGLIVILLSRFFSLFISEQVKKLKIIRRLC